MTLRRLEGLCVDVLLDRLSELIVVQSESQHEVEADGHLRHLFECESLDQLGHVDVLCGESLTFEDSELSLAVLGAPGIQVRVLIDD